MLIRRFMDFIKNEKTIEIYTDVKIVVMILAILAFLFFADMGSEPEFIYNQF